MLGLPDQIRGDDIGICRIVGNHENLCRARKQIDPHSAEKQPLRFGHKSISRPNEDVGLVTRKQSKGQRGDPLDAAEAEDRIRACKISGIENPGVDSALFARRRTGDDMTDSGNLGRSNTHDCRSIERRFSRSAESTRRLRGHHD